MEMTTGSVVQNAHDYDWVSATIDANLGELPAAVKEEFDGGTDSFRSGVPVRWQGRLGPDMRVLHYPQTGQIRITGSPHKLDLGESVGDYGPDEMTAFARRMAALLRLPVDVVMDARVSRFDLATNLFVDALPMEYVRLMSPPPQMKEVGSGPGSTSFQNSMIELIVYDKLRKLRDRKLPHLIPETWRWPHVLRVEARFKKPTKEFKRTIRISDLCSWTFYKEAVHQWHHRVDQIVFTGETFTVPFASTPSEMVNKLASIGGHVTGGTTAMRERIKWGQQSGLIRPHNAIRMRERFVTLVIDSDTVEEMPNLGGEFRSAIDAAAQRSIMSTPS